MKGIVCISGNDPSGGSGIAADIRASSYIGVPCFPVISIITSQTNDDVLDVSPAPSLSQQLRAALDLNPASIKIGLLHAPDTIRIVAHELKVLEEKSIILDTVFASSSGHSLVTEDFISTFIDTMIPLTTILTPNIPEAEALTGRDIHTQVDVEEACRQLHAMGASNILIKGGHLEGAEAMDTLFDGTMFHTFSGKRIPGKFRGTGCSYSTLIASLIGQGYDVKEAVAGAKEHLQAAIEQAACSSQADHHMLFLGGSKGGGE